MTLVKVCGLRDASNALVAAEAGAHFLGFVFVPGVRRQLKVHEASTIIEDVRNALGTRTPKIVGLFADQPVEEVNRTASLCNLDMLQLCGNEALEYCRKVERPVIKVLHVPDGKPIDAVVQQLEQKMTDFESLGFMLALDRKSDLQPGGLGQTFDWSVAEALSRRHRFLLAGGLSPKNAADAIRRVHPWAVDVSSGVETNGVKDPNKTRAFLETVAQASQQTMRSAAP
ncbi:MAG: phosphoribosylanthranilate isomerase [Chloroflexi bacterium]|nr:phosphoribosylanthranilate isomerase [Chloroflexota bacterium]